MAICDKSLEDELRLVENAGSESGEIELRRYLQPLVESVADKYVPKDKQTGKLISAGFEHLAFAVEKYLEGERLYKFSSYFTWFIRQDIVRYNRQT